jgi:hypothetical protein
MICIFVKTPGVFFFTGTSFSLTWLLSRLIIFDYLGFLSRYCSKFAKLPSQLQEYLQLSCVVLQNARSLSSGNKNFVVRFTCKSFRTVCKDKSDMILDV